MIRDLKNQKGAISLFAVLSIMFFIAFMIGAYRIVSANNGMQITALTDIKERYMRNDEEVKGDYDRIVSKETRIPISSYEEFREIGEGHSIVHNGKIYYYGSTKEYTYYFTNDISFDLDREENDYNSGEILTSRGDFIPPSVKLQTHLADSDSTYKIEPGQYDIVYYKNNDKYKLLAFQHGDHTKIDKDSEDSASAASNKEYYSALKTYSTIADTNKYRTSGGKYSYLLMYNIPNVNDFKNTLRTFYNISNITIPVENNGFFSQGLYAKWEQTSSILSESATGVSIKTEGNKDSSATYEAVNINGVKLNPRRISQIHFPESMIFIGTLFRGLYYDSNLKTNRYNTYQIGDNYQIGLNSMSDDIAIYGGVGELSLMQATKLMLFVKIVE